MPLQSKVLNSKYKKRSNLDVRTDGPDRTDVDDNRDCNPQKNARVTDRLYSATYEIRVRERKDFGVSALEGINTTLSELQRIRVRGVCLSLALCSFFLVQRSPIQSSGDVHRGEVPHLLHQS